MKLVPMLLATSVLPGVAYSAYTYLPTTHTTSDMEINPITVTPIKHATAVIHFYDAVIYTDPVGDAQAFQGQPNAQIILVTDIHPDHLSTTTLEAVVKDALFIVPPAVNAELPAGLQEKAVMLSNGETYRTASGFSISAVPMYNHPEADNANYHTKGRGNGYLVEKDGERLYVAGDTAATPEMKALKNIDTALIPMNLPYTMGVEEAAEGVLSFAPKHVYPYHYRGPDGLSDVNHFKDLVTAGNPDIDVELLNWYP